MEKRHSHGRSMIEMLLTLSIIGMLSVAFMWGLMKSFTRHKANLLIEDVKLAGFVVVDEMFYSLPANQEEVSLEGRFDKKSPYQFSTFREPGVSGNPSISFAVVADGVPYNVCKEVKERQMDWLEEILPNGKENICYEDTPNSVSFFFNVSLNTEKTTERLCETNDDCGTEAPYCCSGMCQETEECECDRADWQKVVNYAADGSEDILGQTCCKVGYDTAVGGLCCDASKPYCKQLSYLQGTGAQKIETGIIFDSSENQEINMTVLIPEKTNERILFWGSYPGAHSTNAELPFNRGLRFWLNNGARDVNNNSVTNYMSAVLTCEFTHDAESNVYTMSFAGTTLQYTYDAEYRNGRSLSIFGDYRGASSTPFGVIRIYSYLCKVDNVLVRDFIPVLDNRGKAGMYDKVSEDVFYNSGTGKFIAGE